MNFELADIITDANKGIASSLYIDPLGMLVIWSSYGAAIFEKRVNSISNDVRNFSVNLMHHGVVQSLIADSSFVIPENLKSAIGDKKSAKFAQTCLLHLENIYVFSMLTAKEKNVDTSGILGSNKGHKKLKDSENNPILIFTNKREGQILVRQLGLGVSGLSKGWELELPEGYEFLDKGNHPRTAIRTEWWRTDTTRYRDLAIGVDNLNELPEGNIPGADLPGYDGEKPLFVGHYWMKGKPAL